MPNDPLCQVWLKMAQFFIQFINVFEFAFFCNLPCARIGCYVKIIHKNLLYLHKTPELANVDFFTPHVKACQDTFMKIVLKTGIINTIKNFKCYSGKIFFFKKQAITKFYLMKKNYGTILLLEHYKIYFNIHCIIQLLSHLNLISC